MPKSTAPRTATTPPVRDDPFQKIELPRETGTHGDVLAAVGLADLLVKSDPDNIVTIRSQGGGFAVVLERARRPSELPSISATPGYRYLQQKSSVAAPDGAADVLDYQRIRDEIKALREQESELRTKRSQTKDVAENQRYTEAIDALRQQWPIPQEQWRRFAPYLMLQGHDTANKLSLTITSAPTEEFQVTVQAALAALAARQPTVTTWKVSTVQLFSPNAAKGYARLKPDSTGRGDKTKDAWADPFIEWLRYRGYFTAAVPAFHGSQGEHIRILVPVPQDISIRDYERMVARVPAPPRGASAAKMDILTTLTIAYLLVDHSAVLQQARAAQDHDEDDAFIILPAGAAPSQVISGLAVTNFQSLGNARAVSAMNELAVPGWFPVRNEEDAYTWLEILREHRAIVTALKDDHSDELTLLLGYRRFLEQRGDEQSSEPAVAALLDFAGAYGSFVIRAREAGRPVRQFRMDLFGKVVESMSGRYASMLKDAGFQAIASAVRRATVAAQARKARKLEYREIRYGLLPDLRRASQLNDKKALMIAVAEFIDVYNAENGRRTESVGRPWHASVTTEQFAAFADLVDTHEANEVGALLSGFGTCREPHEADPTTSDTSAVEAGEESPAGDAPDDEGTNIEGEED